MIKFKLVAPTDVRVLITGETGTGKNLIAKAIHISHPVRCKNVFRQTNVGALVPDLAASQLFGHVRGAFTGAEKDSEGIIMEAEGGTLFLDEISSATESVQVMLLTLLETKRINPVGATKKTPRPKVNIRIISATTKSPSNLLISNDFRKDLFFRISEYNIEVLPLRERPEEIPMLAEYFLDKAQDEIRALDMGKLLSIDNDVKDKLKAHNWPGNVRELEHVIRSALVRSREDSNASKLIEKWIEFPSYNLKQENLFNFNKEIQWKEALSIFEYQWAIKALRIAGSRQDVAKILVV